MFQNCYILIINMLFTYLIFLINVFRAIWSGTEDCKEMFNFYFNQTTNPGLKLIFHISFHKANYNESSVQMAG